MGRWLIGFILAWLIVGFAVATDGVPEASDLKRDAASGKPVLVLFMAENCHYCEQVLRDFLVPMSNNAHYQDRIILRRLTSSSSSKLTDFNGRSTTQARFSQSRKVHFNPTVMIFDAKGEPLAEPLVGLSTPDYYGAFLDKAIDQAVAKNAAKRS